MEPENQLTPEEQIKAENALLKIKLELEHGMDQAETSSLSAEAENGWLNNIYNFEQQYGNAKRIKVYDAIGRPPFKKSTELSADEVSDALKGILSVMKNNALDLDFCCPYDDALIYTFITEELFEHEIDDMSVAGMITHFSYEEFHPNHDYDLRRYSNEFLENLLTRKWNPEFDCSSLSQKVSYKEKEYNNEEIGVIILSFQEERTFQLDNFEIEQVSFDVEKGEGKVRAHVAYIAYAGRESQLHQGDAVVNFKYDFGYWVIQGFQLPGFGD